MFSECHQALINNYLFQPCLEASLSTISEGIDFSEKAQKAIHQHLSRTALIRYIPQTQQHHILYITIVQDFLSRGLVVFATLNQIRLIGSI